MCVAVLFFHELYPGARAIESHFILSIGSRETTASFLLTFQKNPSPQRTEVLNSPEIKQALQVVRAWHAGDYVAFFRALRQQGVMHRCLLAQYVKTMRNTAINVGPLAFSR